MVVPWNGFELKDILDKVGVQSDAKYVAFETALRPDEMPGVRYNVLDWPYREGLRLDEALHPLTMMATGIYGKPILNQNGAPIRLVVPWKYVFISCILCTVLCVVFVPMAYMNFFRNLHDAAAMKHFGLEMDGVMGALLRIPKHWSKCEGLFGAIGVAGCVMSWWM